jgi:hypothetical protein
MDYVYHNYFQPVCKAKGLGTVPCAIKAGYPRMCLFHWVIAPEVVSGNPLLGAFGLVCDPVCCPLSGCPIAMGDCGESRGDYRWINQFG